MKGRRTTLLTFGSSSNTRWKDNGARKMIASTEGKLTIPIMIEFEYPTVIEIWDPMCTLWNELSDSSGVR